MAAMSLDQPITEADIKLFKTTLIARRFPGLRELKDEDIRLLIAADRKATGRVLEDPRSNRFYPKTIYELPAHKRETQAPRTQSPFSPINPEQAKESIRRPHSEAHLGLGNPYDGDTGSFLMDKHSDEGKRTASFLPSCASQAKETIRTDVYLYSADAPTKAAERSTIRAKASNGSQQLYELQRSRRGLMLVGELPPKDPGARW